MIDFTRRILVPFTSTSLDVICSVYVVVYVFPLNFFEKNI